MHISDSQIGQLAEMLIPILRDQVVVRFGVRKDGRDFEFEAHLATICFYNGREYLVQVTAPVDVCSEVRLAPRLEVLDLCAVPSGIREMLNEWNHRPFDDWLHAQPFMGAIDVYLDGMPHTSLKQKPDSPRWRFLIGVLAGVVGLLSITASKDSDSDPLRAQAAELLQKRFGAFAAQNVRDWLSDELLGC